MTEQRQVRDTLADLYRQKAELQQAASILGKLIAELDYKISNFNRQARTLDLEAIGADRPLCPVCGQPFVPTPKLQSYCSYRCYRASTAARTITPPAPAPEQGLKRRADSMTAEEYVQLVTGDSGFKLIEQSSNGNGPKEVPPPSIQDKVERLREFDLAGELTDEDIAKELRLTPAGVRIMRDRYVAHSRRP